MPSSYSIIYTSWSNSCHSVPLLLQVLILCFKTFFFSGTRSVAVQGMPPAMRTVKMTAIPVNLNQVSEICWRGHTYFNASIAFPSYGPRVSWIKPWGNHLTKIFLSRCVPSAVRCLSASATMSLCSLNLALSLRWARSQALSLSREKEEEKEGQEEKVVEAEICERSACVKHGLNTRLACLSF